MAKLLTSLFLTVFLAGQMCAALINWEAITHVCKYKKEDNAVAAFARSCAGNERLCRRFFKPKRPSPDHDYYEDCCPGWTKKVRNVCIKKTCIALPQQANFKLCGVRRKFKLLQQRSFYRLTTPPKEPLAYPNETQNLLEAVSFPLLNQKSLSVVLRSISRPKLDEKEWVIRYLGMAQKNQKFTEEKKKELQPFTEYSDYALLLKSYRDEQSKNILNFQIPGTGITIGVLSMEKYMRYPSQEVPFKSIIEGNAWQNDDVFVQQRLAALNPMALRKMTHEDFRQDYVNRKYDWDAAMKRATGKDSPFKEVLDTGKVFIVDYKLLFDISNVEDLLDLNTTDRREMKASRSPFCVFVSVNGELKPVAIQIDLVSEAPVFSPADGAKWLNAKMEIQRADITYAELVEHLLKTHLLMEPICILMRATMSVYHPLHQIFKWHCRGLFVTNSLGIQALLLPDQFLHKLFTIGHVGAVEVLNKAYPHMSWADTEFDKNLQRRGVDRAEDIAYFPYRDDGSLIWKEVGDFARDYVKIYYKSDKDVLEDSELANFANQLSADGTGKNGGVGMFKGFPATIRTRSHLIDVVKRIVFIPIQHHAVNYPVAYYGGFVPNMPTKLYNDPRVPPQEFGFHRLPQSHIASEQISLSMSLGSLRYDVIFDYGKELADDNARAVVNKYHKRLVGPIDDQISARNDDRLAKGKLTYPYLLPKWMPNSIHT